MPARPFSVESRVSPTRRAISILLWTALALLAAGCERPWNSPYPDAATDADVLYRAFSESPRHLDPARSYATDEATFTEQIYEPPLQYHYLKRPYTLIPRSATRVPEPQYLDADGRPLPADTPPDQVATSVYTIEIQPGIRYQPHPAFATTADGAPRYSALTEADLAGIDSPADFEHQGSRELKAADFVHEIKRLASPEVNSPILGVMVEHIQGLADYAEQLRSIRADLPADQHLDLTRYDFPGAQVIDDHHFVIRVKGVYPQLRYWLAMPFFAPVPAEVTRFYNQPALAAKNITIDTFPVGTGPYMLTVNNPNRRMVLEANPNFHGERYPTEGEPGDRAAGLLDDAGQPLPFIKKVVFSLEKESIPYWNKFLQGYYDSSGISSDAFGQAIRIDSDGEPHLTATMAERDMRLATTVLPAIYYLGFNMRDDVVGGLDEKQRKLRQAISIAIDYEAYVAIFLNGRGIVAQGPLPPGITGASQGRAGTNEVVYDWNDGAPRRKSLDTARRLLAEAGYPNGVSRDTGRPLLLHLDTPATGPEFKSQMDWMRQQFDKLGIQLVVRATTWSRFQQKTADGNVQLYFGSGWMADYPDPENFLFLLYGPNNAVDEHGQNIANYENPVFDRLFRQMRDMPDGPERQAIIERMIEIVRRDAPWVWGMFPRQYGLYQGWLANAKPNAMANNTVKYLRLDAEQRARMRRLWNPPSLWPLVAGGLLVGLLLAPGLWIHRRRERATVRRPLDEAR
ncbi:ABC transporter substrate-binding protein [Salinisphaera sp. T31B1]|uniref:ABC transporter substrate-binding protein n=1 Tax=Salinisphaera sp. T31B1 TaxID=727963 RepID=UPI00334183CF